MTRPIQLDNDAYRYLDDGDSCYHFLEYTSGGGFRVSQGNQQILNLKKRPTSSENELYYKGKAVNFWGDLLASELNLAVVSVNSTFVPMPCSKPRGHAEYDDRMTKVLRRMGRLTPAIDIRELLVQDRLRTSQHEGDRLTPTEIASFMSVDTGLLVEPVKPNIVIVDDVITMGASFKAAKMLLQSAGVQANLVGLFLAKTVWPASELDDWLDALG
ncbi:hypothetical protein HFV04_002550 [Pseudomonas sp. BIGb0427]|uniref:hypothetical protein n=1 Tax=Pseudomonas sp. BIGb0427 TaxID=2724470 RepID=UPI0018A772A1|nr:hypothetical protein [Pseudomonas sp. BIGb0427]QPG63682.1 hypothetical protein HFV04_002550 [Pseudomonas sp. BIGb0427]